MVTAEWTRGRQSKRRKSPEYDFLLPVSVRVTVINATGGLQYFEYKYTENEEMSVEHLIEAARQAEDAANMPLPKRGDMGEVNKDGTLAS